MKKYHILDGGSSDICIVVDVSQMSLLSDISRLDLGLTYEMEALILASSVRAMPNHDGYFSMHVYRANSVLGVNVLTPSTPHLINKADRIGTIPSRLNVITDVNDLSIVYGDTGHEYQQSKPLQVIYGASKEVDQYGTIMTLFNYKDLNCSLVCFRFPAYNGTLPMINLIETLDSITSINYTITNQLSLIELAKLRLG